METFLLPAATLSTTQPALTKHQQYTVTEHCSAWVNSLDALTTLGHRYYNYPHFFRKEDGGAENLRSTHKITELIIEKSGI